MTIAPAPYPPIDRTAPCTREDPERFFPQKGNNGATLDATRKLCRGGNGKPPCPFLIGCLNYALTHQVAGVWGGKTEDERKKLRKKYRIQPVNLSLAGLVPMGPGTRSNAVHGSPGALNAHRLRKEQPCEECRVARNQRRQASRDRKRQAS